MPIEFYCTGCSRLLRTPDESAGKKAKCPQCGAIVDVPPPDQNIDAGAAEAGTVGLDETSPFGPLEPAPGADGTGEPAEGFNPYASPQTVSAPAPKAVTKGPLSHSLINFDETMRGAWEFFTDNLGPLALFGLVIFGVNAGLWIIGQAGGIVAQLSQVEVFIVAFAVLNGLVSFVVQTYLNVGTPIYMLHVARTRQAQLGLLFEANRYFLRGLGLTILLGLMFAGATLFCLAPGLITIPLDEPPLTIGLLAVGGLLAAIIVTVLWLRYGILSYFFLVDRDMPVGESLSASAAYMQGNKLTTFLIMLVVGFLGVLFICVTCFFGQILYVPYYRLLLTVIYLAATAQAWSMPAGTTTYPTPQ